MGHTVTFLLLDLAVIIVVARCLGRAARMVGQPAVMGEIVAGIVLGPSLLGLLPGDLDGLLFPADVIPHLTVIGQLGVVLFMFFVGVELDSALLRGRGRQVGTIAVFSVLVPFALGSCSALLLHQRHGVVAGEPVPFVGLMLFMGVAMAVTAFPVLARILADRRLTRTGLGVLALAVAAVGDVLAWISLAFVHAVVNGAGGWTVLRIVVSSVIFVALMFGLVRPLLARLPNWYQRAGRVTPDMLAIVLVGILVSAWVTDRIGIHAIFGAFVFGAVMPRQGARELTRAVLRRLEPITTLLLLPTFFLVAGLGVNLRGFADARLLLELALVFVVAAVGKLAGAFAGARLERIPVRKSAAIAVLLNTRGLTELVILQIGRQAGLLDTDLFTMLVLMALATTALTGPLLQAVYPREAALRDAETADVCAAAAAAGRVGVIADAAPAAAAARMLCLADAVLADTPGEIILARHHGGADDADDDLGVRAVAAITDEAGAIQDLQQCAAQAAASGAVRFAPSLAATGDEEMIRQIQSWRVDVLVASTDWIRRHPRVASALDVVIVTVDPRQHQVGAPASLAISDDHVLARHDGSPDGACAVLLAVRAAIRRSLPLTVVVGDPADPTGECLRDSLAPLNSGSTAVAVVATDAGRDASEAAFTVTASVRDRTGGGRAHLRDAVEELMRGRGDA